jgi:glucose/arabinose dehydrogenase
MSTQSLLCALSLSLFVSACAPPSEPIQVPLVVSQTIKVELWARGLVNPTQLVLGPPGSDEVWVAQLNGEENAGTGQVVAIGEGGSEPRVLLEGLFKPTGLALTVDALWISAGPQLLRAPLGPDGQPGTPAVVYESPNFNGRSNGSLTLLEDGGLLLGVSGQRQGGQAAPGSGVLLQFDSANPAAPPEVLATGLKNAYAHAAYQDEVYTTEISEDPVGGKPPPDEINAIEPGADYGWPRCYGDGVPATDYGGTEEFCRQTPFVSLVLPPQSTPVGLLAPTFDSGSLWVTLWGPGQTGLYRYAPMSHTPTLRPVVTGFAGPHSLIQYSPVVVLLTDLQAGLIYAIVKYE